MSSSARYVVFAENRSGARSLSKTVRSVASVVNQIKYMRTSDFENGFIDEGILDRGREYFILGKVVGLQYLEAKTILANVEGSRTYRVRISVDGGDILNWSCSCPYNAGDI